jgi:hypothetical protein
MKRFWLLGGVAATICAVAFGVPSASGGTVNCTGVISGGTINGSVSAGPGCDLEGVHVTGNVSVKSNGSLTTNGSTIDGNVEIAHTSGTNSICTTSIGGLLNVAYNSGTTSIGVGCGGNTIGGSVNIHNNTGQVTISNTAIGGNLTCRYDSPPASLGTGGNTVAGKSEGECTTKIAVPCPPAGCTTLVSDGNTTARVTVPGGGSSGTLSVILASPPPDDLCGPYGEGGEPPHPSGDIVKIVPPNGYTPGNPIVAEITFNFSQGLFEICKSDTGNPPFTALPECQFSEESDTPINVPCWEFIGGEGSNKARVFITSIDPAIGGHY